MDNLYIYFIVALFPISALMLMIQVNPYQALVIRGILGAIAVLSYIILGAADVALTEGLMGTLLGVALYIIAVRSSFVMRLGILENKATENNSDFQIIINQLKGAINQVHLRLELVPYAHEESLENALNKKEIHGYIINNSKEHYNSDNFYILNLRIKRLFSLIKSEVINSQLKINYQVANSSIDDLKPLEIINK